MTDSLPTSNPGTDVTSPIEGSLEPEQQTPEENSTELFLDMQPLEALANGGKVVIPRSPNFSRKDVVNAFQSAFELVGGVPRLAIWANSHETEFYKLYSRLLPSQASTALGESNELVIKLAVQPGPLDQG